MELGRNAMLFNQRFGKLEVGCFLGGRCVVDSHENELGVCFFFSWVQSNNSVDSYLVLSPARSSLFAA
jgi:hypothetical protein